MTDSHVQIDVPAGVSHDVWNVNNAPRIMQPANDTDFEIEVRFDSEINAKYQLQGLIIDEVLEGSGNFLRFDFYSDDSSAYIFVASCTGNSSTIINSELISFGSPFLMRVRRNGDDWTQSYYDGVNWIEAVTFSFPMSVNAVGVFAGNAGNKPAHTGLINYFYNTNALP